MVDGVAVQSGRTIGVELVTRPTQNGVQVVAVVANRAAGNAIPFDLDLPDGAKLAPQADGSIAVELLGDAERPLPGEEARLEQEIAKVIPEGTEFENLTDAQWKAIDAIPSPAMETYTEMRTIGYLGVPWAVDANGGLVKTHYEVSGDTVTQVLETNTDTAFPVSADPTWFWWSWTAATCAAQVTTIIFAAAKCANAITKINSLISKSATMSRMVARLGGVKGTLQAIHNAAKGFVNGSIGKYLTSTQRLALASLAWAGLSWIGDALGIGGCVSLIKAAI